MKRLLFLILILLTGYEGFAQLSPLVIGDIAPGKTLVVKYEVTINNPTTASQITNQGTIAGTNFTAVTTNQTITPIVSNNANLSALAVSSGALSPPFAASTTAYTLSVANSVSALTVTPTAEQGNATLTVNGSAVASGSPIAVPLAVCGNTISVSVTAQDLTTTKVYTITVNRAAPPVLLMASSPISCTATSVTLTATPGFSSYVFGTGATPGSPTNTATVSTSGVYSVTATAVGGCSSTTSVTVTGSSTPTPISLTASGAISCTNAIVSLTATSGFTSYSFSTGATPGSPANTAMVSVSGVYSVTAINASFCLSTTSFTVTGSSSGQPVSLSVSGPITCPTPSVTLTASSGFVSYSFSPGATPGSPANTASVSTSGVYSVTAVDANSCRSITSLTVTGSSTPTPVNLSASGTISCTNTTVTLTATPGFTAYAFSTGAAQQGGSGGNTATVSTTGVFSVTATNANLCTSTNTVTVNGSGAPSPLSLMVSGTVSCAGPPALLTATPGFVSYAFSGGTSQPGGPSSNTATAASPGTYTVTGINTDGCSSTATATVSGNVTPPNATFIVSGPITPTNPSATIVVSGGGSYELVRSIVVVNGYQIRQTETNTTGFFVVTSVGPHTITVTGPNGCKTVVVVTVPTGN